MNNNVFEIYPMLNEEMLKKLSIKNDFWVCFFRDEKEYKMTVEPVELIENEFFVSSREDEWKPDIDNFVLKGRISLASSNILFNETPLAKKDSVIGIGAKIYSKDSKISLTIPVGEIRYVSDLKDDSTISFGYGYEFGNNVLSEKLYVELFLYLKKAGKFDSTFAYISGSYLGTLYTYDLIIEGNGSIFPIKLFADKKRPLWTMDVSYDTLNDTFNSNTICLMINTAHKDFKYLGSDDINQSNYFLWKEILASFFENLFLSFSINDIEEVLTGKFDEGSIGKFLISLISVLQIEKNELTTYRIGLSEKIRTSLDSLISWS